MSDTHLTSKCLGRDGIFYWLSSEQKKVYHEKGYLHVQELLSDEEVATLEIIYNKFLNNEVPGVGKDLSDITGEVEKPKDFSAISIMLPSRYYPDLKLNLYEKRAAHIASQLEGNDLQLDYDRFIAKKPLRTDSVFHWHQDKLYCSNHGALIETEDVRAVTLSLAFDLTDKENGCIHYIPGSNVGNKLRPHTPIDAHLNLERMFAVTKTDVDEIKEEVVAVPLKRGDATVHGDFVVHGSKGNNTNRWRRNYILNFRPNSVIELQNKMGLERSHNGTVPVTVK